MSGGQIELMQNGERVIFLMRTRVSPNPRRVSRATKDPDILVQADPDDPDAFFAALAPADL